MDPVHRAIGLAHSGWKGTVGKIGQVTVRKMAEEFGSDPGDLLAAVGPSICQECYEVSGDVIEQFQASYREKYWESIFYKKENGKYQLNLWRANEIVFLEFGILPEHISITDVCTCCNPEILYSHRASGEGGEIWQHFLCWYSEDEMDKKTDVLQTYMGSTSVFHIFLWLYFAKSL